MDANGVVLLSASSAGPGKDIRLDLSALPAGATYFVKVRDARADCYGVGHYSLAIGEATALAAAEQFTSAYSSGGVTLETNDAVGGVDLGQLRDNADARWDAVGHSQLSSATDTQTALVTMKDSANALLVAVWATGDISPQLHVTDKRGTPVAFQVLRSDGFTTVIQILHVQKNEKYALTLSAGTWKAGTNPVGYRFAADLRADPITLTTFADGTMTAAAPTAARSFTVTQSQLFRFELTAGSVLPQPNASATLTITDSTGKAVYTLTAAAGQTLATDVFLTPCTYTITITATTTTGMLLPVSVRGRFTTLTDPIGPTLLDPTAPLTTAPPTLSPPVPPAPPGPQPAEDPGYFWGLSLIDPLKIWW